MLCASRYNNIFRYIANKIDGIRKVNQLIIWNGESKIEQPITKLNYTCFYSCSYGFGGSFQEDTLVTVLGSVAALG
jgi:hypothetical protein